ncbi:hypothetical protein BU24DRAFT_203630 [Aaosphaeria arxii CBS 175.79]|uniref:F-box domain-containing protein n=1 Tax=Aaosphaeria arxii CBS 175.79 TaxID=1450172 RepID=A0A6A5XV60_9PLEO|nr:uncharacterized protein BU24DRAFT_203630 [Aaosphaeria arxii CBS 175.79]KAF2016520.1 hypothetical protein BU24DRAFT_203630 [Aaosphaeria arxii CBS 175.79]
MAGFSDLPLELVEFILSYCSQPELYALSIMSKSLFNITGPFLYKNVDLCIRSKAPPVDRFIINMTDQRRLLNRITTLRIGQSSFERIAIDGRQRLAPSTPENQTTVLNLACKILGAMFGPILSQQSKNLIDDIYSRNYGGFVTLIILLSRNLRRLEIMDQGCNLILPQYLYYHLNTMDIRQRIPSPSIPEMSFNVDHTGVQSLNRDCRFDLASVLTTPGLTTLEFYVYNITRLSASEMPFTRFSPTIGLAALNITTIILRHTRLITGILTCILPHTRALRTLVCEYFYDWGSHDWTRNVSEKRWINVSALNDNLHFVKSSLQILVASVECCDLTRPFFQQPDILAQSTGKLDLVDFEKLHTLELPFPFITGDFQFSHRNAFESKLPPNLRHLLLRPDMSRAQFTYPVDTTLFLLETHLTAWTKHAEASVVANTDTTYMFRVTLSLVANTPGLESVTIWQPAQRSVGWSQAQLEDLTTLCKDNRIACVVAYPQLIRTLKAENWNLVKECVLVDPNRSIGNLTEKRLRGRRENGIPLGLGAQYHLHAIRQGAVDAWSDYP